MLEIFLFDQPMSCRLLFEILSSSLSSLPLWHLDCASKYVQIHLVILLIIALINLILKDKTYLVFIYQSNKSRGFEEIYMT